MSEIRISQAQFQPDSGSPGGEPTVEAAAYEVSAVRKFLMARGNSALADRGFHWLMVLCALSIFGIVALIASALVVHSELSWHQFGFKFFYQSFTDPYNDRTDLLGPGEWAIQRAAVYLWDAGFVVSGAVDCGAAGYRAGDLSYRNVPAGSCAAPLAFLTELLAAIPSVIYGLWAVFVLVPLLREHVNPLLVSGLGWTGLFADDNPTGLGISGRGRDSGDYDSAHYFFADARGDDGGAALAARGGAGAGGDALGDDPDGRAAQRADRHCGRHHSGLGRALGETMAVTMVIGNTPEIHHSLLANGSSMATVIANEYAEAVSDMHLSALIGDWPGAVSGHHSL